MSRRIGLILAMLAFCAALSAALSAAQPADPCADTAGSVARASYRSQRIQTTMYYSVYTPPCDTGAPLPTLYLLHGSASTDSHWLDLGLAEALDARISAGELPPLRVVLPFGEWVANQNQFGEASWEAVFLGDLLPVAEAAYPVAGGRRAVGGISRGGFWAYSIALRHPGLFESVGGHSAFFDLGHAPAEHNPLALARTLDPSNAPRLWLDRGLDDYAAPGLDIMHTRLTEAGIAHTYRIHPQGAHNDTYWRQHLSAYLDFYAAPWRAAEAAPTPTLVANAPLFATNTPRPPTSGIALYLPAVAFPSTRASIAPDALAAVLAGGYDAKLTLSIETLAGLAAQGIAFHPDTVVLDTEAVYTTLWRDRTRWTILPFDTLTPRWRVLWVGEATDPAPHPLDVLADGGAYPLAFITERPNYDPAKLTRIVLSGVTALTRDTRRALDENGVAWAAEAIRPYVSRADFFHTSNEVSIYPTCPQTNERTYGGALSFCAKAAHFELFSLLGLDIVELSGNHNNDYGYQAYLETLAWYAERGIRTVGGGTTLEAARAPLVIEHGGNRIAWLSCNWVGPYYAWVEENPALRDAPRPGAAPCDRDWLRGTLAQLNVTHDVVIVTLQYWEFDQHAPTAQQRIDFAQLAAWGADVVVGTQAHYPQTYAFVPGLGGREAFVHYGLGNFYFDQAWWAGARFNLDQLFIYDGKLMFVDVFPGIIEGKGRPRPMTPDERDNFWFIIFNRDGGM